MQTLASLVAVAIHNRQQVENLTAAHASADRANRHKSDFLAHMSHEIRTPLNGVLGMAELLSGTELDDQQGEHGEILRSSGELLLSVINSVLDFSRIESGKLELETAEFDPRRAVKNTVALMAPAGVNKGLEVKCDVAHDVPERVVGDSARLQQVVTNLMSNAIKFTDEGEVAVRSDATELEG